MSTRHRTALKIALVMGLILLGTFQAVASSPEGGDHHFDWGAFLGKVLNSTLLFGGLILLLRKPIIKLLSQKSLDIKEDITRREEDLAKASGQFQEINRRLEKIEGEIEKMKSAARKGGEKEKKRIEELGKRESDRLLKLTEDEIHNKVDAGIRDLKARIAELSIEHFKKDIRTRLDRDPEKHRRIIEENINRCGEIIEQ